jgi:hypothetical protein
LITETTEKKSLNYGDYDIKLTINELTKLVQVHNKIMKIGHTGTARAIKTLLLRNDIPICVQKSGNILLPK